MKRKAQAVEKPGCRRDVDFMTLTFAECVENHAGMELIGKKYERGILREDLLSLRDRYKKYKFHEMSLENNRAVVVVIPGGVAELLEADGGFGSSAAQQLYEEILHLPFDNQYYDKRTKKVFNKHGRLNNCFADRDSDPDIGVGRGTVVDFAHTPLLSKLRARIPNLVEGMHSGKLLKDLYAETNLYVDVNNKATGIGFHGDTERAIVVGVRLGAAQQPLRFRWYHKGTAQGEECVIDLGEGDMYIMCEKATGGDWKKSSMFTLRHGVGLKAKTLPVS